MSSDFSDMSISCTFLKGKKKETQNIFEVNFRAGCSLWYLWAYSTG